VSVRRLLQTREQQARTLHPQVDMRAHLRSVRGEFRQHLDQRWRDGEDNSAAMVMKPWTTSRARNPLTYAHQSA